MWLAGAGTPTIARRAPSVQPGAGGTRRGAGDAADHGHHSGVRRPARAKARRTRDGTANHKRHTQIAKLMDGAEMKERLVGLDVEPAPSTPDQLAVLMRADLVRWAQIVKDIGAQLDQVRLGVFPRPLSMMTGVAAA